MEQQQLGGDVVAAAMPGLRRRQSNDNSWHIKKEWIGINKERERCWMKIRGERECRFAATRSRKVGKEGESMKR